MILHHGDNRTDAILLRLEHFVNELDTVLAAGHEKCFLADIRRKLVPCHVQHLAGQLGDYQITVGRSAMLEYKLHNIVLSQAIEISCVCLIEQDKASAYPELVLHEVQCVLVQLVEQRPGLLLREALETSLQHATSIGMRRQFVDIASEIVDEL